MRVYSARTIQLEVSVLRARLLSSQRLAQGPPPTPSTRGKSDPREFGGQNSGKCSNNCVKSQRERIAKQCVVSNVFSVGKVDKVGIKKCTRLWHQAHVEVKILKALQVR